MLSNEHSHRTLQWCLAIAACVSAAAVVCVAALLLSRDHAPGGQTKGTKQVDFNARDFKQAEVVEMLYGEALPSRLSSDEAVLVLYYLKEMNEVFGDPDMKVFIDASCFIDVYDATMNAKLQSMFWSKVLPHALIEVVALLKQEKPIADALSDRYPILSGMARDLSRDLPNGTIDRMFLFGNMSRIVQTQARAIA